MSRVVIRWAKLPRDPFCILSEDGRWSISKALIGGKPRYSLWDRKNRMDTGFYSDSLEAAMKEAIARTDTSAKEEATNE
ncbi:MAG: hypothetical protein ACYCY2_02280 [Acidithiobacillus ferriphilus]